MKNINKENIIHDDLALLDKEEIKWNQETLDAMEESNIQVQHPEWGTTDIKKFMEDLLNEIRSENN